MPGSNLEECFVRTNHGVDQRYEGYAPAVASDVERNDCLFL